MSLPDDKPPDSLVRLRGRLDEVDSAIHRLMRERFDIVADIAAAKGPEPTVIRPAREGAVIENRLAHHTGAMPRETLVHLWRCLIASSCAVQGPLTVHVLDALEVARYLYGTLPARIHADSGSLFAALSDAPGDVAVIDGGCSDAWWRRRGACHAVARLALSDGGATFVLGGHNVARGTGPRALVARGNEPPREISAAEITPEDDVIGRYHPFPVTVPVAERTP